MEKDTYTKGGGIYRIAYLSGIDKLMEDNFPQYEQVRVKKRTASFIVGGILCAVAILCITASNLTNFTRNGSAYAFGAICGALLVPSVALILVFRSKSVNVRANGLLIVSIIMLIVSITNLTSEVRDISQEAATEKMLDKMVKYYNGGRLDQTYSETVYGENAKLLNEASKFINDINYKTDEYKKKTSDIKVLDINDYKNKSKLEARITQYNHIIECIDGIYEPNKKVRDKLEKLVKDSSLSIGYKAGFNKKTDGLLEKDKKIDELLDNEKDILSTGIEVFQLLIDDAKNITVENGKVVFSNQTELDKYNGLREDLKNLADEEKELAKNLDK